MYVQAQLLNVNNFTKDPERHWCTARNINTMTTTTTTTTTTSADIVLARSREVDGGLQVVILSPVVELVLKPYDLLKLPDLPVCFVTDKRAVKMDGKHNKDKSKRHHDAGRSDGRSLPGTYGAVVLLVVALQRQELDPTQEHHFGEEEEGTDDGGEGPGQLDVAVHALVRRLVDRVEVVHVADGLQVGKDAGADHEGEEVHGDQHCGAGAEGYQEPRRILIISLQLHLYHGNLGN